MPRNAGFPDGRFLLAAPLANEGQPRVVGSAHRLGGGPEPTQARSCDQSLMPNPVVARATSFSSGRLKNPRERRCHRVGQHPVPALPSLIQLQGAVGKVFLSRFLPCSWRTPTATLAPAASTLPRMGQSAPELRAGTRASHHSGATALQASGESASSLLSAAPSALELVRLMLCDLGQVV